MKAGDLVRVRPFESIAGDLDGDGCLDGLPFMPEMVPYCGRVFGVRKRADRLCLEGVGMGLLSRCVFLDDVRCDGSAHGGCGRGCAAIWHETWLEPVTRLDAEELDATHESHRFDRNLRARRVDRYVCQSTELPRIAKHVRWWQPAQYLVDVRSGQVAPGAQAAMLLRMAYKLLCRVLGIHWHGALAGRQNSTPVERLGLLPGEIVRMKRREDLAATLDVSGKNRGLEFSPEMLRFCGGTFRVGRRVDNIIIEETGEMRELKNTVLLEGVTCDGSYRVGCPRSSFMLCREAWLERVPSAKVV
jgi:hypothetical protein